MKFSYPFIKKFLPKIKSKAQVIDLLSSHAFEAEDAAGNAFEVNLPPNRYSDAASHWGIAKEISAAMTRDGVMDGSGLGGIQKLPVVDWATIAKKSTRKILVENKEPKICTRYTACVMEGVVIKPSPRWIQDVLKDCGLRPINNVVDAMNYVMLEMGQPLHAFDLDKLEGGKIVVRRAKKGEEITTIDGTRYALDCNTLVIADAKNPVAIAGIKGGHGPEVSASTKRILIESATFDSVSVYQTSKMLKLVTDASQRFAHTMSPEVAALGLARAAYVMQEIAGAKIVAMFDSQKKASLKRVLKFDVEKWNQFIGANLTAEAVGGYLRRLGFILAGKGLWEVPPYRTDIETHEDLAEEVGRLIGFNTLKAVAPRVPLRSVEKEAAVLFKEKVRTWAVTLGADELYTHSFISKEEGSRAGSKNWVELEKPVSAEFHYLRPSLIPNLLNCVGENAKYRDALRLVEVGKIFARTTKGIQERTTVAIVIAAKNKEVFFDLKGFVTSFLQGIGIVNYSAAPGIKNASTQIGAEWLEEGSTLTYEEGKVLLGFGGSPHIAPKGWRVAVAEFDLDALQVCAEEEHEYEPLPRFPSVMRDISCMVDCTRAKVGDIMQTIQQANLKWIEDVDLVDEYAAPDWVDRESITLRIVFQAEDRTLTAEEVDREMKKIIALIQDRHGVEVR